MKRKLLYLLLPIVALILEILPYGAVCVFVDGSGRTIRETYAYFDLTPYGYANFAPLLTAVMTCMILAALVINLFTAGSRLITIVKALLCIAVALSVCPLLYGISYYSLVGALITAVLAAQCVLLFKRTRYPNTF